jgi:mono/diheme cytochrome c family protein
MSARPLLNAPSVRTRSRVLPLSLALVLAPVSARAAPPSRAAILFGKKCGSCHTLGEGDRTGPDLLGVTKRRTPAWMKRFVAGPGAAIDSGDPVANGLVRQFKNVRMPDQTLTDEDFDGLVAYLDGCAASGGCRIATGQVKNAREGTRSDVARGRRLFEGRTRLANGGPPCISCHNVRGVGVVGGGTLAKDLTFVYARLGDAGLSSALENTPFPLMTHIYPRAPLREYEAFQLKSFLYQSSRDGTPARVDQNFLYLGVLGMFGSLGVIGAVWSGRMRGVRRTIVTRRAS